MKTLSTAVFVALSLQPLTPVGAFAQSAENVAVVINDASPASQRIGEYYARKRGLPAANVIHIQAPTTDEIAPAEFAGAIEGPIANAIVKADLQDRILYIVLTKGVPVRIKGTVGQTGTSASVDSELTLLYRRLTGAPTPTVGPTPNPYFLNAAEIADARPFSHAQYDIYLVTRLDAFTVEDALRLVDRGAAPNGRGKIVLDEKNTLFNRAGEDWLDEAAKRLTDMGRGEMVVVDRAAAAVRNVDNVLGYASWGSNDPENRVRDFGMHFVPGAVAIQYVSTDARTFEPPPDDWVPSADWNNKKTWYAGSPETLAGDIIREGATGVAGQVSEPFLGGTVRPQILFPAYVSGFNLAESFYLAIPAVSWQTVVIGDPLCRPFPSKAQPAGTLSPPLSTETGLPQFISDRTVAVLKRQYQLATDAQAVLAVRAQARLGKGDRQGARTALTELVKSAPSSVAAQVRLADILNADGEYDAAIEHYRAVLRLQPNNVFSLNNLAYLLAVQKHQVPAAKELADEAIRLRPNDPSIADTAGWVAYLGGDYQRASRLLAQAAAGAGNNADIHLHAAFAYEASGARAAALTELNTALKLNAAYEKRDDVQALKKRLARD
jgi:uncharacterized protein (TIGR03790 family)